MVHYKLGSPLWITAQRHAGVQWIQAINLFDKPILDSGAIDKFMAQVIPIDRQIEKLYQSNEQLTQARDLLLPRLMSGEISV